MAYERINWQNEPSEATALNDVNLNKMDNAIYELDGKATTTETAITNLQNGKVDKVTGQGLSKTNDVQVTSSTNVGTEIATVQIFPSTGGVSGVQIKNGVVVDDALSSSSENPVQNKVVKGALDDKVDKVTGKGLSQVDDVTVTQHVAYGTVVSTIKTYGQDGTEVTSQVCNGIVVDSSLSDSSTNPVQNKVVKSAIDGKSTVAISDTLATGTTLANITIDGTTTAIKGSDIEVDEELSPTSTNPVENKAIYDALNNLLPSKTVSGNPIAISDASGFNAKALIVSMNPIQDLHGYSNPWAGGAWKNKFQTTAISSGNFTVNLDGTVTVNGSFSGTSQFTVGTFDFKANTQYKLVGCPNGGGGSSYALYARGAEGFNQQVDQGDGVTFTPETDITTEIRVIIYSGYTASNVLFKPMISTDTSVTYATFAPYSNICPISGRTKASVTRTGKNLAEFTEGKGLAREGTINDNPKRIATVTPIPIYPNKSYIFSFTGENVVGGYAVWNGETLVRRTVGFGSGTVVDVSGGNKIYLTCYRSNESSSSTAVTIAEAKPQLEWGTTATAYEPYTVETHTHQYGQTVYGGEDDFVNGGATSEYHSRNCDGTEDWQTNGSSGVYIRPTVLSPNVKSKGNALMSIYKKVSDGEAPPNGCWNWNSEGTAIQIRDERAMTASAFKTLIATDNNLQICYELATPTTIETSAENISLLKGNNVVSTNADDMELKYSVSLDSLLS